MNITLDDFDEIMKKVIDRQIELKSKLSPAEMVSTFLNNMKKGYYNGITSSCLPFFKSINIEKTMESLMGCDFESAVYLYSKRMESMYNKKDDNFKIIQNIVVTSEPITKKINSMEEAKDLVDSLFETRSYKDVNILIKESYQINPSLKYYVDEGDRLARMRGGIPLQESFDNKIENFINYVTKLYEINKTSEHKTEIKNNVEKIDSIINLPFENNQKIGILTGLFYGNDNSFNDYLPEAIDKEYVQIALIRNIVQTSLVSTNIKGFSTDEGTLYSGIVNKEDFLICARSIINKLLGQDSNFEYMDISAQNLSKNLTFNLNEIDVENLALLYIIMRRNSETINILENADSRKYKLESGNSTQFSNTSHLLKVVESEEFYEKLKSQYHI